MARINTANPLVKNIPHKETGTRTLGASHNSPLSRESCLNSRNTAKHTLPTKPQSQSQRQANGSSGSFDIFPDSDSETESKFGQYRSTGKQEKQRTLGLARVNSLLLPAKRRPRPAIRRETEDYDKENDMPEYATDGYRTPELTPTRPNASQAPTRSRMDYLAATQPVTGRQEEQDEPEGSFEEEDSSDSLDGFIVSDNDEPSFFETSDSEIANTEDEPSPATSPVRSPRKRLLRGRRPVSQAESNITADEEPSMEVTKLATELDRPVEKSRAVVSTPEDCAPNLATSFNSTPPVRRAEIPKPKANSNCPLHFGLRSPHDLIQHLENLELDSDNESVPQTYPEQSNSELEDELPSKLYPSYTKQPPITPSRPNSHLALNRSITSVDSSPGMGIPTTIRAQKRAEAARKREIRAQVAEFNQKKIGFAEEFLRHLDNAFDSRISSMTKETGGIKIIWTKNFRNTAGRATVRSERFLKGAAGVEDPGKRRYYATIELSEKVLDSEDKILCTMTHEYCHLLDIMVTENRAKGTPQHGASFKQWGDRCVRALEGHPIYEGRVEVTTKHTYEINHKYVWACKAQGCDFKVGRHSKSVDPKRQFCGRCRGGLEQIKPVPRAAPRRPVVKVIADEREIVVLDP
ncbi:hypothetical protein N7491_003248 [Penicillium cf. griseofulvum]|uniref:SprT-like domain-containing protein n=1 Tax=Penicillium cf. griseofulvum TaxID=2972120 RepID=A0A9W9T1M5_9EURO|nr:hypothetical protein N7472_002581 [Penicillium cf. griseofulvum]KAJ5440842.1 hypothetical protein N7491_003248 [Penicillium cf. griseofulvum]KAJ5448886.1 hypothetical protein N7445_003707 [Penicillium cf. griseofulvum]